MWLTLAWQSLVNRLVSTLLTLSALIVSASLLFSIEHIRTQTQENFKRTVSGIDIVVAARSSQVNVLLSSVFRMGANPNAVTWETYERISNRDNVSWTVPISLGDSYKGFPVVGTTPDYFKYYKYGRQQTLQLAQGREFASESEVVLGANVAESLNLQVGQKIVVSHGSGEVSFTHHDHHPILITGILAPTGTPVDKSLHIPLIAVDLMHQAAPPVSMFKRTEPKESEQEHAHKDHDHGHDHDTVDIFEIPDIAPGSVDLVGRPTQISAFFLKAESPFAILTLQRDINQYQDEAVSAIMPQVALSELWQIIGSVEAVLQIIALLVLLSSLFGLVTMQLSSMHQRQGEISVLRAIGASPWFIASLIQVEAALISFLALVIGYFLVSASVYLLDGFLLQHYGIFISANIYSSGLLLYSLIIMLLTCVVAAFPALSAYRRAKFLFK